MPEKKYGRLNNYLAMYRKRAGLSQAELATLVGADSKGTIGRYESGEMVPDFRTLIALSTALEQRVDEIFGGLVDQAKDEVAARAQALLEAMSDEPTRENMLKLPVLSRLAHPYDEHIIPWEEAA